MLGASYTERNNNMIEIVCRRPGYSVRAARAVAMTLIIVSCTIFNCSLAFACSGKARAFSLHTRKAAAKARMPHEKELDGMIVDYRDRRLVKNIRASQIASIQFTDLLYGPLAISMPTKDPNQVVLHPYFEPTVADRRLITRFLQALRYAYKQEGAVSAEARPVLEITFRKSGHFQREPLDITINSAYLGPEFQSVLNEVPGYLADRLHRKIRVLDGQVREVDFATTKVTDPQKIAEITRALKQVKPIALGVYGSTYDTYGLRLLLRHGGSEEVVFVLEHSDVSRLGSKVLPRPLWDYFKFNFSSAQRR